MGAPPPASSRTGRGRAYGAHLAACLDLPQPRSHVSRTLRRGLLALSELRTDRPSRELSASLGYDDAYSVAVHLRPMRREMWRNGRFLADAALEAGTVFIVDMRQDPRVLVRDPWHSMHVYLPISTLSACAEENGMPAFAGLADEGPAGLDDPVMRQLADAASAVFAHPHRASGLLLDAILDAVCIHMIGRHGVARRAMQGRPHGLAPWQERRAKELMEAHLDLSLSDLARECGLSVAHFGRAFKRSTGMAPHQWQLSRRISRAQAMLAGSALTIAEIALACGFSGQSHFATAFRESTGIAPGRWRRSTMTGQPGHG